MSDAYPIPSARPPTLLVERPWGAFSQYATNQPCTVSLMVVQPGLRLSLQSHARRAELWIVLDEGAVVQVGDEVKDCSVGEEIWISVAQKHRLSCKGLSPCRVLEVAFGDWEQTDITRYEDDFQRVSQGDQS